MKVYEFDAEIRKHEGIDGAYIEFPYDVAEEFGTKGQVKVLATFDGCEYRGSLAKMGSECHILGLTQKIRSIIGKQPGDSVHVVIKKDEEPRTIEVPDDFKQRLDANEEARRFFDSLSYTNRKEYVNWITGAKKPETREKRLADSITMLAGKIKRP